MRVDIVTCIGYDKWGGMECAQGEFLGSFRSLAQLHVANKVRVQSENEAGPLLLDAVPGAGEPGGGGAHR